MLPHAVNQNEAVEGVYYTSQNDNIKGNPFDWIFDQWKDDSFVDFHCYTPGTYSKVDTIGLGPIEKSPLFPKMQDVRRLVKVKSYITDKVDKFYSENMTSKTLSVHVRTADMNLYHPEFGVFGTDDYIAKIGEILQTEDIDRIFVASDNMESIDRIGKVFGNVVYYDCRFREKKEVFKDDSMHVKNFTNPLLWEEAFVEMLLLGKGCQFLCRVSNLANAAIIFSDTITKVHRL
jgi:hypothetical protein